VACANVLSDLYAMGVERCHNMLMLLGVSKEFTEEERDVVVPLLMKGFQDTAREAGCLVTGGQTVVNPWCTIGGVASSVCTMDKIIMPEGAKAGEVLILTKPLGTQIAVNANQWQALDNQFWKQINDIVTVDEVKHAYEFAMHSMARLNRNGAKLMIKYNAHGATDVTGFGILGHAQNLAENQIAAVNIEIHSLPIIKNMVKIEEKVQLFKLLGGFSAETSGGLFICLPADKAQQYIDEIKELDHSDAWIIGKVVENKSGNKNSASIIDDVSIIEV